LEELKFHVFSAKDGLEAYELIKQARPDVVVSDYRMPRLNGVELYRKMKSSPDTRDIPFVLVSGAPPLGIHSDVPVFFQKPLQIQELLEKIKTLTET
jgi:CheY-like chemotaxis protein